MRLVAVLLFPCMAFAANVNLTLNRNYFVTGDYAIAGVGLQASGVGGVATGNVNIAGVPANATILAAWLYWETMEGAANQGRAGTFNGSAINGTALGTVTSPCQALAKVTVYRADVLQFLTVGAANALYGSNFNPNGAIAVSLPDSGAVNTAPSTLGASLVIIWSIPGRPFKSVVLFDGAFTIAPPTLSMSVTLSGFYQAATAAPAARVSHIVGNGGVANATSDLLFNNQRLGANPNMVFTGAQGRAWDNPTFDVSANLPGNAATATTGSDSRLLPAGLRSCLTWSAIVMSTTVQDTDGDGLLDTWETNGFTDTDGSVVDLKGMGANPNVKDIFIEMDYMNAGAGEAAAGHKPKQAALDMMCAAFAARNISLHFDVGQGAGGAAGNACTGKNALFSGGNAIAHSAVVNFKAANPADANPNFNALKTANFANNRRFLFHYMLWGHQYSIGGVTTSSGVADLPGGDTMITLGAFTHTGAAAADTMIGTTQEQAGTMMHEFGHNLFLHHAGSANTPNFIPQYQSVMNYGYQMLLLQNNAGVSSLDYSGQNLGALNDNALNEGAGVGAATYRTRYFSSPNALDNFVQRLGFRNFVVNDPRGCVPQIVNRQSPATNGAIDWNNNGQTDAANVTQDIGGACGIDNHNGSNDWAAVDLQQIASRPNYVGTTASFPNNPNSLDVPFEEYVLMAPPTPTNLSGIPSGGGVNMNWSGSDLDIVSGYEVYRLEGTDPIAAAISNGIVYLGFVPAPLTSFNDVTASSGTLYTYFVSTVSEYNNASGPSNFATVTTP